MLATWLWILGKSYSLEKSRDGEGPVFVLLLSSK